MRLAAFAVNDYGKPAIAAEHIGARGGKFNLSDTDGLVLLGVTRGCALSADVENMRTRAVELDVADTFCAARDSIPLKSFALFLEDSAQIALTIDGSLQDGAERWWFWCLQLRTHHLMALCRS